MPATETRRDSRGRVLGPRPDDPRSYDERQIAGSRRRMPRQRRGQSRQDYGTPSAFIAAVCHYLDIDGFAFDLAASPSNAKAPRYYTAEDDALRQSWVVDGWAWLNPPFAQILPWVYKARLTRDEGGHVAILVPASVGSQWWAKHVHNVAAVLFLNGRLTFEGESQPYPKDCALLLYAPRTLPAYSVWTWREQAQGA